PPVPRALRSFPTRRSSDLLGAAAIAPPALIKPAADRPDVEIVAVAARDITRAGSFASKHRVGRVHDSYDALLAAPDIDAIYNPRSEEHTSELQSPYDLVCR